MLRDVVRVPRDAPTLQLGIRLLRPGGTLIVKRGVRLEPGPTHVTKPCEIRMDELPKLPTPIEEEEPSSAKTLARPVRGGKDTSEADKKKADEIAMAQAEFAAALLPTPIPGPLLISAAGVRLIELLIAGPGGVRVTGGGSVVLARCDVVVTGHDASGAAICDGCDSLVDEDPGAARGAMDRLDFRHGEPSGSPGSDTCAVCAVRAATTAASSVRGGFGGAPSSPGGNLAASQLNGSPHPRHTHAGYHGSAAAAAAGQNRKGAKGTDGRVSPAPVAKSTTTIRLVGNKGSAAGKGGAGGGGGGGDSDGDDDDGDDGDGENKDTAQQGESGAPLGGDDVDELVSVDGDAGGGADGNKNPAGDGASGNNNNNNYNNNSSSSTAATAPPPQRSAIRRQLSINSRDGPSSPWSSSSSKSRPLPVAHHSPLRTAPSLSSLGPTEGGRAFAETVDESGSWGIGVSGRGSAALAVDCVVTCFHAVPRRSVAVLCVQGAGVRLQGCRVGGFPGGGVAVGGMGSRLELRACCVSACLRGGLALAYRGATLAVDGCVLRGGGECHGVFAVHAGTRATVSDSSLTDSAWYALCAQFGAALEAERCVLAWNGLGGTHGPVATRKCVLAHPGSPVVYPAGELRSTFANGVAPNAPEGPSGAALASHVPLKPVPLGTVSPIRSRPRPTNAASTAAAGIAVVGGQESHGRRHRPGEAVSIRVGIESPRHRSSPPVRTPIKLPAIARERPPPPAPSEAVMKVVDARAKPKLKSMGTVVSVLSAGSRRGSVILRRNNSTTAFGQAARRVASGELSAPVNSPPASSANAQAQAQPPVGSQSTSEAAKRTPSPTRPESRDSQGGVPRVSSPLATQQRSISPQRPHASSVTFVD